MKKSVGCVTILLGREDLESVPLTFSLLRAAIAEGRKSYPLAAHFLFMIGGDAMRSEEAKQRKKEYIKEWRKKNPDKVAAITCRYWTKKYRNIMNQTKQKVEENN